jgi:tRNA(His) 5'-end guanylyltransferase
MQFDDFDKKMRVFETSHDHCVLPGIYIVARLDGRGFSALTKEAEFEKPFDGRFHRTMTTVVHHLMVESGFRILYGYTESDEISLLFHLDEDNFGRKIRKFNSVLAGEASAKFSCCCSLPGVFDCRISQLPSPELVIDYFRWRQADAHRNALNSWCYWTLRQKVKFTAAAATKILLNKSVAEKNELLFGYDINFDTVPAWQKRGSGLYWEVYDKEGTNPQTGEVSIAQRRRIHIDEELPIGDDYRKLLQRFITSC